MCTMRKFVTGLQTRLVSPHLPVRTTGVVLMRYGLVFGLTLFLAPFASSQDVRSPAPSGFSFDYDRWPYPLNEEIGQELRDLAAEYPDLAKVHRIGESERGKPLWVIEVTNFETGPGESKPGIWADGNIHAGELTGRPYLRYFVRRLLSSYGKDERTTRMLDTRAFYVMPVFDVDGGDMVLSRHPAWPGFDPDDQLGDDLDGDGYITLMRVTDGEGAYGYYKESLDALDPRSYPPFLQRRRRNELTGEREGADFNRNWSAEWSAAEPGAGPRPFSLPEVATVADFILDHDNIFFTYTIHSGGGARSYMVRPPMDLPYDWMPGEDNFFYERIGAVWAALSKGGLIENNYYSFLFTTSRLNEDGEQQGYSTTMAGFADDWAYMDAGLHSLTPEVNGSGWDYDKDGWIRPQEEERWHQEEKGSMFDSPWTPYDHPTLGRVEIGGSRGIPPALDETLREHCEIQYDYLLYIAELSPLVRVTGIVTQELGNGRYRVSASIQNQGGLPTYVTRRAIEIRRDAPVVVTLEVNGGGVVEGKGAKNIGHLAGFDTGYGLRIPPVETVEWVVRIQDPGAARIVVSAKSPKAGAHRSEVGLAK